MSKQILIDSYFGLVRTAIAEGPALLDYYEESPEQGRTKGNIYRGLVKNVDAPIQAAFVRFGGGRDGFLPLRDAGSGNVPKVGDSVLVQVVKDEIGDKGAALTTKLSYSGRYLVFIPDRGSEGGISSRIADEERASLKKVLGELRVPEGGSVILRTAAMNKGGVELQADLDRLTETHRDISGKFERGRDPGLIFREVPPALRYLREYYTPDVGRIWVNQEEVLNQCRQFFHLYEPESAAKVVLSPYGPLMFHKLGLETEVDKLNSRKVVLPSGANIVIDQAEALVAIDVNSAKAGGRGEDGRKRGGRSGEAGGTESSRRESEGMKADASGEEAGPEKRRGRKPRPASARPGTGREGGTGSDLEETVFAVNREAAGEIARQLRLRDLGGIIIVDFIDMEEEKHRRQIEDTMRKALAADKAKIKVFEISPLGIMQISRQRLRKAGPNFSRQGCEACAGRGWHPSSAAGALAILRKLEERLHGKKAGQTLAVSAPYPVANKLLNEYREHLLSMERRFGCALRVTAMPAFSGEAVIASLSPAPEESKREPAAPPARMGSECQPAQAGDPVSGAAPFFGTDLPHGEAGSDSESGSAPMGVEPVGQWPRNDSGPAGRSRRGRTGRSRQAGSEGGGRKPALPPPPLLKPPRVKTVEPPGRALPSGRMPAPVRAQQAPRTPQPVSHSHEGPEGSAKSETPHRRRRRSRRGKGGPPP